MGEYSPTMKEFVYSFMPWQKHSIPTSLEGLLYFDIKVSMALGAIYARTAYIMITTGATFVEAGYIATNNWTSFKWMSSLKSLRNIRYGPHLAIRSVPYLAAPVAYGTFVHATVSDPIFQKTGKPFWMPLPIWVLMAGDGRPIASSPTGQSGMYMTPDGHYRVDYSSNPHWI